MPPSYSTDIVIFGGGVAGLWLLNRLTAAGYGAILLENKRLGGGQSIHSQGIIHGGLKYALQGALSGASRAIAAMPGRWRACIAGRGEIDLSRCELLSPHFQLWSGGGVGAGMKAFLGSKAVAGKAEAEAPGDAPQFLQGRGTVYRLPDFVVDTRSLIAALAQPHAARVFAIDPDSGADAAEPVEFERTAASRELRVAIAGKAVTIRARRYVFCAGEGNERLLRQAGLLLPRCQLRPLKMVSASGASLPEAFLHVLGAGLGATPLLTITSHRNATGERVWYLGGELAEAGVNRSNEKQIEAARLLLADLLPGTDLNSLEWRCLDINRAEPASPGGRRPDNAAIAAEEDVIAAWPVKLALAPVLADMVLEKLREDGVAPASHPDLRAAVEQARDAPAIPANPSAPPPFAAPFWG